MLQFEKKLQKVAHRYSFNRVLDDFLQMSICALAHQTLEELYFDTIRKYDKSDLNLLAEAFTDMFIEYNNVITKDGSWNDLLGDVYMENASKKSAGNMGQFFTPVPICQVMASMVSEIDPKREITVNDCACGSSRNLMAHNRLHPNHRWNTTYVGQDLDYTCVMMSVINYVMCGMKGIVIHINSITNEIYSGYRIFLPETGLLVRRLTAAQCVDFLNRCTAEASIQEVVIPEEEWQIIYRPIAPETPKPTIIVRPGQQGSLFD